MIEAIVSWYNRYLGRVEAGQLAIIIALFFVVILGFYKILLPLFISIIIAYLLEQAVVGLVRCKLPRKFAVILVFLLFLGLVVAIFTFLLPTLIKQLSTLSTDLPAFASQMQIALQSWLHKVSFISDEQISMFIDTTKIQLYQSLKTVLASFLTFIPSVLAGVIYFVMVPLLVYFLLMDKEAIVKWLKRFMPTRRATLGKIWAEIYSQLGNYVRGKVLEAILVGALSNVAFLLLGLEYAALLGLLVGLSVFIPYVGAVVVTIPVVLIGLLQWGVSAQFIYLLIVFGAIMAFDGTVLTAILFSEAVSIHPLAIIVATLVFGGLWGIWGVFFAIPLASAVKALITHWPVADV